MDPLVGGLIWLWANRRRGLAGVRRATNIGLIVLLCTSATDSQAQDALHSKPPLQKLDSELNRLMGRVGLPVADNVPGVAHLRALAINDRLPVTIRTSDPSTLVRFLAERGLAPANILADVIEVYSDTDTLRALNELAIVRRVELVTKSLSRVTSQGVAAHNGPNWHAAGLTGNGVKVGIVDTGFQGFASLMGSELPSVVVRRCYAAIGLFSANLADCQTSGSHGTAVAEALVDVAPHVQLFIANPISKLDFHHTLAWMTSQGVRVINYSVARHWDGPGDGTSPNIDSPLRAVDAAVAAGAVFITAAGNEAPATWFGPFTDLNANGFAEFGGFDDNFIDVPPLSIIDVQLRWNDSWLAATRDLDLGLYDSGYDLVALSTDAQSGLTGQQPHERLSYVTITGGRFYIGVRHFSGQLPTWLQLQEFSSTPLGVAVDGYSIGNPAESGSPGLLAVGASSWQTPSAVESFSSRGPTPDGRIKPDLVGVNRGDSVTYGPSGFVGTSQASPHVAGLAALVVQGFPAFQPAQVADYLKAEALPRGSPLLNNQWGWGLAHLPSVFAVTLVKRGSGDGVVTSTPDGLNCGLSCTALFLGGGNLTLTATASAGSLFNGWSGPSCTGTGSCSFNVTSAVSVTATFGSSPCTYSLDPSSADVTSAGGTGSVNIAANGSDCAWSAVSNVPWMSITGGASGVGAGTITYSVSPNPSSASRSGTVSVAGQTFSLTQAASSTLFTRYLAEGATGAFFDTSIALLNPGSSAASVLLRFLNENGTTVNHQLILPAHGRRTINPETLPGLASASFSTVIESDAFVVVDRTMTWAGGYGSHAETGVLTPANTWYLAEGSTSGDFSLFYLLQNPSPTAASTTVRYLLPFGAAPIERTYQLPPNSRTTIPVDDQGGVLGSTDVSAVITSTAAIIAERAMYKSTLAQPFAAGHESAGVTAPATSWFLAEGATGPFFDLFILLANPSAQAASVTLNYLLSDGTSHTKAYGVPANGRFTIWVDDEQIPAGSGLRPLDNVAVSTTITSSVPIIVERTMWWPSPTSSPNYWTEAHNSPGATETGTRWAMAEGEVGGGQSSETYILIANTSSVAGQARVTLYFEDGTSATRTVGLQAKSRTNVNVSVDFAEAFGRRFGAVVESLGTPPAQIVVERAMYTSPDGVTWAAGTNALATRLP